MSNAEVSLCPARVAPEKRIHRPPADAHHRGGQGDDMAMTYGEQLKHPNWQRKRLEVLQRDSWKCRDCGNKEETLHVHHMRYVKGRMAWEYEDKDLVTLCSGCHEFHHDARSLLDSLLADANLDGAPTSAVLFIAALAAGALVCKGMVSEEIALEMEFRSPRAFDFGVLAGHLGLYKIFQHVEATEYDETSPYSGFRRRALARLRLAMRRPAALSSESDQQGRQEPESAEIQEPRIE